MLENKQHRTVISERRKTHIQGKAHHFFCLKELFRLWLRVVETNQDTVVLLKWEGRNQSQGWGSRSRSQSILPERKAPEEEGIPEICKIREKKHSGSWDLNGISEGYTLLRDIGFLTNQTGEISPQEFKWNAKNSQILGVGPHWP